MLATCAFASARFVYSSVAVDRQEATKFKAALGEPEFQAMLRDYMEEMQDPKQREVSAERERGGHRCRPLP